MRRSFAERFNVPLYLAALALSLFGWLMVYSASGQAFDTHSDPFRQAIYFGLGLVLMGVFTVVDYDVLGRNATALYGLNVVLLGMVLAVGRTTLGAQRWIDLGSLGTFQPSEPAKLLFIITLSRFLSRRVEVDGAVRPAAVVLALVHLAVPFLLIMRQPDLGTALVLMAVFLVMLFVVGVSPALLLSFVAAGLGTAPYVLKPYQKSRLLMFLNPEADPDNQGYNLIQSKTAIGAGRIWGQGLFAGRMNRLQYVPEHKTDFIFSVVGEELGLVGGVALVALYVLLLTAVMRAAGSSRDLFGTLLVTGIATMLGFHVFVNIGMTLGIMPVTGIPLPFVSYGGSAPLTNFMALGVVGSVFMRRSIPYFRNRR